MNIIITGANGFVGRNLHARLETIRDGKDHTHPELQIDEIYSWTRSTTEEEKHEYCRKADFVFHLAGVNRPERPEDYMSGNLDPFKTLLQMLRDTENSCPVMLSGSAQASLTGRFAGSAYGKAKLACEQLAFRYAEDTGVKVLVYRFPNIFGKWCRPNYNSAVATFCYNIANDLPVQVNDESTELTLLYIDDLVEEMLQALSGHEHRCKYEGLEVIPKADGRFCYVPVTHVKILGEIVSTLQGFRRDSEQMILSEQPEGSFEKKLYATWLSYFPKEKISAPLKMNLDSRGSFTELLKSRNCGQVSVNISRPGITKGQHWHNTKWEFFIVVSGHGLIQERKIGSDEVLEFEVSGEKIEAVRMLPGYTHNIINLSDTEDLITVMWANELFDPDHPDTYHEDI